MFTLPQSIRAELDGLGAVYTLAKQAGTENWRCYIESKGTKKRWATGIGAHELDALMDGLSKARKSTKPMSPMESLAEKEKEIEELRRQVEIANAMKKQQDTPTETIQTIEAPKQRPEEPDPGPLDDPSIPDKTGAILVELAALGVKAPEGDRRSNRWKNVARRAILEARQAQGTAP